MQLVGSVSFLYMLSMEVSDKSENLLGGQLLVGITKA